jgi:hypothetical protein
LPSIGFVCFRLASFAFEWLRLLSIGFVCFHLASFAFD